MMTNRRRSLLTRSAAVTLFVIALPGIACAFDPYGTWMRPSTGTQVKLHVIAAVNFVQKLLRLRTSAGRARSVR